MPAPLPVSSESGRHAVPVSPNPFTDGDNRTPFNKYKYKYSNNSTPAEETDAYFSSGRSSTVYDGERDNHLEDLEKSLPIHTIPSLRLDAVHSAGHGHRHHHHNHTHQRQKDYDDDDNDGKNLSEVNLTTVHNNHHGDEDDDDHHDPPSSPTAGGGKKLPLRQRLRHFTWAWYTLTMSTGGLALLIAAQPHQFPGLRQIGLAVYIINILLFSLVTSAMATRFLLFRGALLASVTHPREGLFFPTFFLSIATLITGTQRYCVGSSVVSSVDDPTGGGMGQPPLVVMIRVAFWTYLAVTTLLAIGQYSYVFAAHSYGLQTMMPTWILPIFPVMLSGTIASVISETQPKQEAVEIVVAGLTCQGLGIAVAFMMYAHMVGRLMQSGLPHREHRTGLFMCVGPPAFTALAFIGLSGGLPENFDHDLDGVLDGAVVETMGVVGAGFLWALSFWWFGIAVLAVVQSPPKHFHLGWWAGVFPNTGFTLATISLGNAFQSDGVLWFATAMSVLLLLAYCFVLYHHVRAVIVQDIMYPGRDEDVEDH
ncbi:voltage-dependent anion channel-domain-containing protein [Chaetomium strumarium]|uniref:Voltage-dependent anion channel-domain-containing protein n=1 Tax=Chaetomium strumarium TaxID=1170767 RepID=A0AAJ0GMP0_9PEZI|nr:voltage-dependent anion channel-domain-containing protein [Chaetomium strumarium]